MFSLNSFIDVLQNTKRTLTNKIITDTTLNKAAHNFIDAQTAFAKMLVNNAETLTKYAVDSNVNTYFPGSKLK